VKFLSDGIGKLVLEKLGQTIEARLAVAFFNPDDQMLNALLGLSKLKLIVSEEFTINNPYKLEKLRTTSLRSIPPDDKNGKLHAKVLIAKLQDGSYWTLLGSANLTHQGMFSNQEACLTMDSDNPADEESAQNIRIWFDSLFQVARQPNLTQAKLIFDERAQYRIEQRPSKQMLINSGYWVLKTTSGSMGKQFWPMFLAESVIAVGWAELPLDPSKVSMEKLRASVSKTYPSRSEKRDATNIKKFVAMEKGDIVLLCRGYTSKQKKDVHIHGLARVTGSFRAEAWKKGDWRFKHDAVIQEINMDLPIDIVASALGKQSLRGTIHALKKSDFDRLAKKLKEFGVHVEV
jgi:HKD family nuclease